MGTGAGSALRAGGALQHHGAGDHRATALGPGQDQGGSLEPGGQGWGWGRSGGYWNGGMMRQNQIIGESEYFIVLHTFLANFSGTPQGLAARLLARYTVYPIPSL